MEDCNCEMCEIKELLEEYAEQQQENEVSNKIKAIRNGTIAEKIGIFGHEDINDMTLEELAGLSLARGNGAAAKVYKSIKLAEDFENGDLSDPVLNTREKVEHYEAYKEGRISKEYAKKYFGDDFEQVEIIRENDEVFNDEINIFDEEDDILD